MKTVLLASVVVILIGGVFWYMFQYRGNTSETSVTDGHLHSIYLVNPGGPAYKQYFDKVESSLRELHHKNGTSLQMYTKNAEGNPQKLATMVTEAVQAKPNLPLRNALLPLRSGASTRRWIRNRAGSDMR